MKYVSVYLIDLLFTVLGNKQANKSENHAQDASESMSQISGFRRSLSHANSLPGGESVPKFGVSTEKESELAEVFFLNSVNDRGLLEFLRIQKTKSDLVDLNSSLIQSYLKTFSNALKLMLFHCERQGT